MDAPKTAAASPRLRTNGMGRGSEHAKAEYDHPKRTTIMYDALFKLPIPAETKTFAFVDDVAVVVMIHGGF